MTRLTEAALNYSTDKQLHPVWATSVQPPGGAESVDPPQSAQSQVGHLSGWTLPQTDQREHP